MCLIVVKPAGNVIPDHVIESAYEYNSDGFGIMHDGKARRWQHRSPEEIKALLKPLSDTDVAVHFRMATDGKVSRNNAHPFKLQNKAFLMHNGILSKYRTSPDADKSDTREFIDRFCNPLIKKHGSIPRKPLEQEIYGNAICIMQRDGVIQTYGDSWLTRYGCQFSNTYAWDSAEKVSAYVNKNSYIDDDFDAMSWRSYSAESCMATIYHRLSTVVDCLPFYDYSHVMSDDLDLHDSLLDGTIDEMRFLQQCTDETLLELYTVAARSGLI